MKRFLTRRQALSAAGLGSATTLMAAGDDKPAAAKPPASTFKFEMPTVTSTASLNPKASASIVSPDGQALSILFGDPKLGDLQIGLGDPSKELSATKLVTFRAAITAPADRTFVGYRNILHGFLDKGKGSRVVIVADLAGSTKVIEYPYGQEVKNENFVHAFFSPDVNLLIGTEEVPPLPEFAGTILLMVQTRSPNDRVIASIDAFDAEARLTTSGPVPPQKKRDPKKR